jgi:hypothetical protein
MQQHSRARGGPEARATPPAVEPIDFGSNAAMAEQLAFWGRIDPAYPEFQDEVRAQVRRQRFQLGVEALSPDQRAYFESILQETPPRDADQAEELLHTAASSRPLTEADRQQVTDARAQLDKLKLEAVDDRSDPNLVQILVTFDGTWNDREQMPVDTNPALLYELAPRGLYQRGVGTSASTALVGGALGAGAHDRIEAAYAEILREVATQHKRRPEAQFVFVLTGFSRGAATARAFAHVLEERGIPGSPPPRIGALVLFDSVNTSMSEDIFDQTIPSSVENVLHLTAAHEHRFSFPLTSARDPRQPDDPRVTEIALPGAHSDIGGSYPNAYSGVALGLAHDYLTRLGIELAPLSPGAVPDLADPALRLHDSDWAVTRMLRGDAPPARAVRSPRPRTPPREPTG